MLKKISRTKRIKQYAYRLLVLNELRHYYCRLRWFFLKKNLETFENKTEESSDGALDHNLARLDRPYVFGMQGRMVPILYALSALTEKKELAKILIVGPRTEDDIFLAKSLGFTNTIGLDLISYSHLIRLGDMHKMPFQNEEFDAVIFGWVIAYSSDPIKAAAEAVRVSKKGGYIGIGWEWVPPAEKNKKKFNTINSTQEHLNLFNTAKEVCFSKGIQEIGEVAENKALIFKKIS